ncbi:3-oxoacyl-[acyl-carrier protein] reductase [Clostridium sp. DSM 8431]|uniref:SDR family NAD(P)-dependent oxidoreductase n=1 Tax=Clostridium sp. DSM 8431 TaxID=1761781 RepID=UPI0008EAD15A|nr:SDR family NAD(P)-dependent oxidoreductase [Clostridium sp. DSM 8431]SFU55549.1 3-oxoacyl-[acyl-carrier protein] reductase [Clostridium sp. DSM 8431]
MKIAVVTGAANGIANVVANDFLKKGYKVIALDKDISNIEKSGFYCYNVDVTKSDEVRKVFNIINKDFGKIDILVNTVGATLHMKQIEYIEDDDWDRTFNLNLKSAFNCIRSVVPIMKKNGWGRIVNISAVAGRTYTFFGGVDFTAAKSAIIGLTQQCAFELASYGITVNAIAPGLTLTERVKEMWENKYSKEERDKILERIPIGRPSTVEEQAKTICFLCSEEASYICGAVIDVNGAMFV